MDQQQLASRIVAALGSSTTREGRTMFSHWSFGVRDSTVIMTNHKTKQEFVIEITQGKPAS